MKSFYDLNDEELKKLQNEFEKTNYGRKVTGILKASSMISLIILMLFVVGCVASIVIDSDISICIALSNVSIFLLSVVLTAFSSLNINKCLKTYYEDTKDTKKGK